MKSRFYKTKTSTKVCPQPGLVSPEFVEQAIKKGGVPK